MLFGMPLRCGYQLAIIHKAGFLPFLDRYLSFFSPALLADDHAVCTVRMITNSHQY